MLKNMFRPTSDQAKHFVLCIYEKVAPAASGEDTYGKRVRWATVALGNPARMSVTCSASPDRLGMRTARLTSKPMPSAFSEPTVDGLWRL